MVGGEEAPALQVIVLGSGGGPREDNTTAFLIRSVAAEWKKGSILALDAGVHLSAIIKIFEEQLPTHHPSFPISTPIIIRDGPFAGFECPHASPTANAAYITRELIDTYVITHPHLDHITGFVVNTASLQGTRPKQLAGLPTTIEAFKRHIFNNVIWPNLSDENNGAGLVTYLRLAEGGSPALGEGPSKGYSEVANGLSIKPWSVSHGHCMERHSHRGSSVGLHRVHSDPSTPLSPTAGSTAALSPGAIPRSDSAHICVYDSSAYFVREVESGKEVLMFGDVEPDSVSLSPRNRNVWIDAAPKIVSGALKAIFIECSYDDSHPRERLFGHLAPRYLIEELHVLASLVETERYGPNEVSDDGDRIKEHKKRKRQSQGLSNPPRAKPPLPVTRLPKRENSVVSPRTVPQTSSLEELNADDIPLLSRRSASPLSASESPRFAHDDALETPQIPSLYSVHPLLGIKVVIIHMKDNLDDNHHVGVRILEQLNKYEEIVKLGVDFQISKAGQSWSF